jgi:transposase
LTTKIHMLADRLGRSLRFILTPGQAGDVTHAPALLLGRRASFVIADTAYDIRALRQTIVDLGAQPVIPSNPTRKHPFGHDRDIYRLRNRIERCFNKLKHFRRFATRYDRRARHFLSFVQLAASILWMR